MYRAGGAKDPSQRSKRDLLIEKCFDFLIEYLLDNKADEWVQSRIIKRLFDLVPTVSQVTLSIKTNKTMDRIP